MQAWLEAVLAHWPELAYVKDLQSRHLFVNPRFEAVLGIAREEALGKTNEELFPPESAASLDAHDRRVIASGAAETSEEVISRPDGVRTFASLKIPLRDEAGRIVALCGLSTDVTEQRRAEATLARERDLTQQLLSSSFDGILAFDTECRYTWWNPAMERISGMPAAKVVGRRAFELFPFLMETGEDHCFREALAGRTSISRERMFTIPESGRQGLFEGYYSPVRDAVGNVVGGLAVIRDVTERRHAEEERVALARAEVARARAEEEALRFAFLAEASQILSSSLDCETMLGELARVAVPVLGDYCILDVIEGDQVRRVATVHATPEKAALLEELRRRYPPSLDTPQPVGHVLRTGTPHVMRRLDDEHIDAHTRDAEHAALIRAIGMRSHITVPLVARGVVLGAIGLGITDSDHRYGPDDVGLATELAQRAALALENTRLYAAAQQELAERRRTERALRVSELRCRAVIDQSPLSTQIFRADGLAVRVNRAWEELWGFSLEQLGGYNVLADAQLEARGIGEHIRQAFRGEPVAIPAIRYDPNESVPGHTRHSDAVRWVRAFAYPVKDEHDALCEVVLVHEDVTAQTRAEQALRTSEERLRLALAGARMNVWDWDLVTRRVECSENARELWGIDSGRVEDFVTRVHPDDEGTVRAAGERALAGEPTYLCEYRIVQPDHGVRWVQSRGRVERDAKGTALRIYGVTIDISEIKAVEDALQLLADAGEALGATLDPKTTLDELTRVVVPALADWCTVDLLDEAGGLERVIARHRDPARSELAMELFRRYPPRVGNAHGPGLALGTGVVAWGREITDEMLRAVTVDDEHLAMMRRLSLRSYVSVPLRAIDRVIGVLTLVYAESGRRYREADVELVRELGRRAAAALENARLYQQLRAEDRRKDEFLATLAHELRNPLAPIRTGLEVMRIAADETVAARARETIERQVEHMVRLVDDLLDLSRVTRGKIELHHERVELRTIVGAALEASLPAIDAAGLQLEVHLPVEPVALHVDRTRMAQVLGNLLNNAAKYTERGGRVTLTAELVEDELAIAVEDTGVGIPREMLTQVFEMFTQLGRSRDRSQGGLGIGLTLVRRLVELHGGRVWAHSEGPGHGSRFVVRLPRTPSASDEAAAVETPATERAESNVRRVLVVDDNQDAAEMLAALLQMVGHEVETAAGGHEALALIERFWPDVALLDIGMPGMDGYELARRLRAREGGDALTLVALTGWGQEDDRRRSQAAGFDQHVTKPVDPALLRSLIEAAPRGPR